MVNFNMTEVMIQIIGGLGLFLYGMNVMGEGLQKSAGDKMKSIVEMLKRFIKKKDPILLRRWHFSFLSNFIVAELLLYVLKIWTNMYKK